MDDIKIQYTWFPNKKIMSYAIFPSFLNPDII